MGRQVNKACACQSRGWYVQALFVRKDMIVSYVVIEDWMCSTLQLKGNDLLIFALIHGFSQDGESRFHGSRKYISTMFNISMPTVDKALKNLLDKGFIEKHTIEKNNMSFNEYNSLPGVKKLYPGGKVFVPNKIDNNTNNNFILSKDNIKTDSRSFLGSAKKEPKTNLFTQCRAMINDFSANLGVRQALQDYLNLRLQMKDKPLRYANQWKGLLNKLQSLSTDSKQQCEIIQMSIIKGWATFVIPDNNFSRRNSPPSFDLAVSESYTQEELEELEELDREREKMGIRTKF